MPEGLLLTPLNSKVKIEPVGENNPIKATVGHVITSSIIDIPDVFGSGPETTMMAKDKIEFLIHGVRNQLSTKDAGGMKVTTFTKIDGEFYEVDNGETKTSFIADASKIMPKAHKPLIVSEPITSNKKSTWTLRFSATHRIPATGYIKVEAPNDIEFYPLWTTSGGTCR